MHLIMWPMSSNALNYVAYVKQRTWLCGVCQNYLSDCLLVQKIDRTSLAASIVVQTTITGYDVHTI